MSIKKFWKKINPLSQASYTGEGRDQIVSFNPEGKVVEHPILDKFFLAGIILLVASVSFGLGRLMEVGEREPVRIEYDLSMTEGRTPALTSTSPTSLTNFSQSANAISATSQEGAVVGSRNSDKYHYPHCPGAKQISEANKITFPSVEVAETSGYSLARNCTPR